MSEFCTRHRRFYALYFKDDSEKTEVAVGDSISEVLANVQAQTGRPFLDFSVSGNQQVRIRIHQSSDRGLMPVPATAFCSAPKQPDLH